MNISTWKHLLANIIAQSFDSTPYLQIIKTVNSMSRPCVMELLNKCTASMNDNDVYLEAGTHLGCSLISALIGNDKKAVAIDNFSQFDDYGNEKSLRENLRKFNVEERVTFYNADFREVFLLKLPPIGVYYYDANHSEEDTYQGLSLALPHLHKGSLIIIDDFSFGSTEKATNQFLSEHPKIEKIFYVNGLSNHENWWNGIGVLLV